MNIKKLNKKIHPGGRMVTPRLLLRAAPGFERTGAWRTEIFILMKSNAPCR